MPFGEVLVHTNGFSVGREGTQTRGDLLEINKGSHQTNPTYTMFSGDNKISHLLLPSTIKKSGDMKSLNYVRCQVNS